MTRYYVLLFLVIGTVLLYVFLQDPCNQQFRSDFAAKYPAREIVDTAGEGDAEKVYCHMYYRQPEMSGVLEEIWVYRNDSDGWKFSGIKESRKAEDSGQDG